MTSSTANVFQDGNGNLNIKPIRDAKNNWTWGRIETQRTDFQPDPGEVMAVEARATTPCRRWRAIRCESSAGPRSPWRRIPWTTPMSTPATPNSTSMSRWAPSTPDRFFLADEGGDLARMEIRQRDQRGQRSTGRRRPSDAAFVGGFPVLGSLRLTWLFSSSGKLMIDKNKNVLVASIHHKQKRFWRWVR